MKRNIFLITAVLFFAAGFLPSCSDDKDKDPVIEVKSVMFKLPSVNLSLGDEEKTFTVALTYTLEPAKASNIVSVNWSSSNTEVATVSQSGLVTSIALGETTVTVTVQVTDGKTFTDRCIVNVVSAPISVEDVEFITEEGLIIPPGGSTTLQYQVLPEDASNKSVLWESNNEKVATVNQEGLVTAVSLGTAVISVTTVEGGFKARYTITVKVVVTGVELEPLSKTVFEAGEEVELVANVLPEDATNKKVTWESSDPEVATVDDNGKVTAKSVGSVIITVTTEDGEFEDACEIEVKKTDVTGVELEENTKLEIPAGNEVTLKANILPANASNKKLIWESSDPLVATVDEDGKVTAIDVGNAFITVTTDEGGFEDTREIEVLKISVLGVRIGNIGRDVTNLFKGLNNVYNLTASIAPSNATINTVTWESSDTDVADVDQTGKLTLKSVGVTTITVTTTDGGFTDNFMFKVNEFSFLDRSNWSIYGYNESYADNRDGGPGWSSQAPYDGGARITAILTDEDGQFWHASWSDPSTDYPHWFIVDLGEATEFDAVMLRRRTDNGGTAKGYTIYTSDVANPPDNDRWTNRGDYTFDPSTNDRQAKPLASGTVKARYILMYFDEKHKGSSNYTMFSQFGLYKRE